jgi:hypothetical protein
MIVVMAAPAAASDLATARKLFEEGIKLEEAGNWSGALAKFRDVAKVRTNHIVRFHIALCLEKTGKLVDALSEFSFAKVLAEKEGGTDADLTIANATKHIDALRARVPSVQVKKPREGAVLRIDGASALFDATLPLDPGEHAIEVRVESYKPFMKTVTLIEGVRDPVIVEATLEPMPVVVAPPPPPKPVLVDTPPDRTVAYVVGGLGVASLIGAGVFYGLRASTLSDLDATCKNRADCDPDKRALDDRGRSYTLAGNVLLGVGVAAVATSVVLVLVQPSRKTSVAVGAGSISLTAAF